MNVNHDQRVIIDQQHFVQNSKVLVQTHDPAYTEMLEQRVTNWQSLRRKLRPLLDMKL